MTANQRERILTAIAEYVNAEVDLALVEIPLYLRPLTKSWIARVNNKWKLIEDLLVIDAWEIK